MERMTIGSGLIRHIEQVAWDVRRGIRVLTRQYGIGVWGVLALVVIGALAWSIGDAQRAEEKRLASQLATQGTPGPGAISLPVTTMAGAHDNARTRLNNFETYLLPHAEIPGVVQNLLLLAEKEGLVMLRGEYRPQADIPGGFLRYQMSLPVKGSSAAIYRFIQEALREQKTLALESVQFKRDRIESPEIEARIQWVVMTHLPRNGEEKMVKQNPDEGVLR